MHRIKGKDVRVIEAAAVAEWAARYRDVMLDLGTGDGRFVRHLARSCPEGAAIGVDTCQANLRTASRTAPANALFVVGDGLALPADLHGLATRVSINYPWGSLLRGLLDEHAGLLAGLRTVGRGDVSLAVRLNAGALSEAGWALAAGGERVARVLEGAGFAISSVRVMGRDDLRNCPTTWAKRLAFGSDPRAVQIEAVWRPSPPCPPLPPLTGVGIENEAGTAGMGKRRGLWHDGEV